jgi:hypothetical protein
MMTNPVRIIFSRQWKLQAVLAAILTTPILSCSAQADTPSFPEANVIRGRTAGGHPYLNGGRTFDEQCAIERASRLYNLKIVFARPTGTLTAPRLLMIGFNDARHVEKIPLHAPWFYIRLPSGGYTLLARFQRDVVLIRDVDLREGHRRTYFLRGD